MYFLFVKKYITSLGYAFKDPNNSYYLFCSCMKCKAEQYIYLCSRSSSKLLSPVIRRALILQLLATDMFCWSSSKSITWLLLILIFLSFSICLSTDSMCCCFPWWTIKLLDRSVSNFGQISGMAKCYLISLLHLLFQNCLPCWKTKQQ